MCPENILIRCGKACAHVSERHGGKACFYRSVDTEVEKHQARPGGRDNKEKSPPATSL